jgi:hypothetical protein
MTTRCFMGVDVAILADVVPAALIGAVDDVHTALNKIMAINTNGTLINNGFFKDTIRDGTMVNKLYISDYHLGKLLDCISSNYRHSTFFDEFGFAGLIERARFGFHRPGMAARY